jgi:predicted RNA-binding Zn ribbon-like protein
MTAAKSTLIVPRDDLCLAFANTRYWRGSEPPTETLGDIHKLFDWAASSAGLSGGSDLKAWADAHPGKAGKILDEAIGLREAIYRAFSAIACANTIRNADLALINDAIAQAPARDRVARTDDGYAWRVERAGLSAPELLGPVLWSAGDLLTRKDHARVRRCANDKCLWLFVDESRNGTRRWCDMSSCGNRAKAHRHYLKTKQG